MGHPSRCLATDTPVPHLFLTCSSPMLQGVDVSSRDSFYAFPLDTFCSTVAIQLVIMALAALIYDHMQEEKLRNGKHPCPRDIMRYLDKTVNDLKKAVKVGVSCLGRAGRGVL